MDGLVNGLMKVWMGDGWVHEGTSVWWVVDRRCVSLPSTVPQKADECTNHELYYLDFIH